MANRDPGAENIDLDVLVKKCFENLEFVQRLRMTAGAGEDRGNNDSGANVDEVCCNYLLCLGK